MSEETKESKLKDIYEGELKNGKASGIGTQYRKDGTKKVRVTVNNGWAIRTDTKAELYQLVFTMIMPKNFQLIEALEYDF